MKYFRYLKILTIFISIIFVPDFILSLGGRDTYLLYRHPVFLLIGRMCVGLLCIFTFVKMVELIGEKRWIKVASYCMAGALVVVLGKETIELLEKKSITESQGRIAAFLKNKGANNDYIVEIDDDAIEAYRLYLAQNFNPMEVKLVWQVPRFGIYEYHINSSSTVSFFLRHYTSQLEADRIWVHKDVGTGSGKGKKAAIPPP